MSLGFDWLTQDVTGCHVLLTQDVTGCHVLLTQDVMGRACFSDVLDVLVHNVLMILGHEVLLTQVVTG